MTDKLQERLREAANNPSLGIGDAWNLLAEAADRIDTLCPHTSQQSPSEMVSKPADAVEFFRVHSAWLAESWEMSPEGREYKRKFDAAILCLEIALAKEGEK